MCVIKTISFTSRTREVRCQWYLGLDHPLTLLSQVSNDLVDVELLKAKTEKLVTPIMTLIFSEFQVVVKSVPLIQSVNQFCL